ncbi:hypothetical protein Hanom_Chr10g00884491 [Helianthus anomalus]
MNECSRTHYQMLTYTIKRTRHMFMFARVTNRTKLLVYVRSFIKRTNVNKLSAEGSRTIR